MGKYEHQSYMSYSDISSNLSKLYDQSNQDLAEIAALHKILPHIEKKISNRYTFKDVIAKGGAGVVFVVEDTNLGVTRALKCARPVAGKEPILSNILASEISKLRGASHQNVVTLFYSNTIIYKKLVCPFYIMEYVEGGQDFYKFLKSSKQNEHSLILMLQQFIEGHAYLHTKGMIHGDIKLENALVTPNGRVMISDLGSARFLSSDPSETMLVFTRQWAHPKVLRGSQSNPTDDNRANKKEKRNNLDFSNDFYPLGQNILRILMLIDPNDTTAISPYTRTYLQLIAARLLDGENSNDIELPLGLTKSTFNELKYTDLKQVIEDLRKLTGEYSLKTEVPELDEHYPNRIQCSYPKACAFTPRVQKTIATPLMRRLGEISQLGMMVFVYPTATHTRLEHSLGTYAMACRYCNALWHDPINPFFKQIITPENVRSLLCAALCHDIGQYGLAHDFEDADRLIFNHATLTDNILRGKVDECIYRPFHDVLLNDWNVQPSDVACILSANPTDTEQPILHRLLHTIIDGPIDADKADYLIRDSRKLGLPYGDGIDMERLVNCLTITFNKRNSGVYISVGVHENGKIAAEAMAFARYALFGSVYWHHTSRSAKSMLCRAIWDALPLERDISACESFEKKFENFVLTLFRPEQLKLFDNTVVPYASQLSLGDVRLLIWLYDMTSNSGKKLVEQIMERQLFKRLMVVSYGQDQKFWEYLHAIRESFTNYNDYSLLQTIYQTALVDAITSKDIDELQKTLPLASILNKEILSEIKSADTAKQILLTIDIPRARPASANDLEYLSEERIEGRRQFGKATSLEDSVVWKAISTMFVQSVGKARIFVHPKYAKYFEIMLSRDELKTKLKEAENTFKIKMKK